MDSRNKYKQKNSFDLARTGINLPVSLNQVSF